MNIINIHEALKYYRERYKKLEDEKQKRKANKLIAELEMDLDKALAKEKSGSIISLY